MFLGKNKLITTITIPTRLLLLLCGEEHITKTIEICSRKYNEKLREKTKTTQTNDTLKQ